MEKQFLANGLRFISTPSSTHLPRFQQELTGDDTRGWPRFYRNLCLKLKHSISSSSSESDDPQSYEAERVFISKFKLPTRGAALSVFTEEDFSTFSAEIPHFQLYSKLTKNALERAMKDSEYTSLIRTQRLNHSHQDRAFIYSLIDDSSITCKPADKNLGLVLVDTTWYDREIRSMLDDRTTYQKLNHGGHKDAFVKELQSKLYTDLQRIVKRHELSIKGWNPGAFKQVISFMQSKVGKTTARMPEIYLLIKVHKPKGLCGRPIVPCTRWTTTPASILVDHLLQEIVLTKEPGIPWLVKDTKSFVNELERIRGLRPDGELLTADIGSLYTNIETKLGLRLVREFLNEHQVSPAQIELIMDLLAFVMNNSYLSYCGQIYMQIDGTAMGTQCAPIYANIVVFQLERSVVREFQLDRGSLDLYRRFLDDIFCYITPGREAEEFQQRINQLHPRLKFEFVSHPNEAAFLDLHIFKGERFRSEGRFDLRVHQKKMNLYLYIPYLSFHTEAAKKSFIQTELTRYIRNTSSPSDYISLKEIFYQRLRDRGYPREFLRDIFDSIFYSDRDWFLLPAKELISHAESTGTLPLSRCLLRRIQRTRQATLWTPDQITTPPTFIIPYSPLTRVLPVRDILSDRWELIQLGLPITKPIIAYQSQPSLLLQLVFQKARKNATKGERTPPKESALVQLNIGKYFSPITVAPLIQKPK